MQAQIDVLPDEFGESRRDLPLWVHEAETAKKCLNAGGFGGAYRFAEQFLACHLGVVHGPVWSAEEVLCVVVSAKPVDEDAGIDQDRREGLPRLLTHPMPEFRRGIPPGSSRGLWH